MRVHQARSNKAEDLPPETLNPSQTAINQAISKQAAVITEDLNLAGLDLKAAESIVVQGLRAVVAIPLYASSRSTADTGAENERGQLLGVLYLDSRRIAAFSALDRQILDALAVQAASIMDNARLVERERERQRLEQELSIARTIQQALLPQNLNECPHLAVTGVNYPCHEVGGDYYDVVPMSEDRTAILIADVSGKGLGAALLTTMLQGALSGLTMGADPVKVFNHVNRFLCRHAEVGRYATMFIGMVGADGTLEYIKAGHPSPLLLRNGKVSELYTEGSFPVGLIPEAEFTSVRIQLEPDDTLVLFSDGVTEAEDPDHELFEVSGLTRVCPAATASRSKNCRGRSSKACESLPRASTSPTTLPCWLFATARRPSPAIVGPLHRLTSSTAESAEDRRPGLVQSSPWATPKSLEGMRLSRNWAAAPWEAFSRPATLP